jgi:hypothetical protein
LLALGGIFDDVDDVAEMDDRGRLKRGARTMHRIPAVAGMAHDGQDAEIVATAAAVIEQRRFRIDEAVGEGQLHRPRQGAAADRRFVPGNILKRRSHGLVQNTMRWFFD